MGNDMDASATQADIVTDVVDVSVLARRLRQVWGLVRLVAIPATYVLALTGLVGAIMLIPDSDKILDPKAREELGFLSEPLYWALMVFAAAGILLPNRHSRIGARAILGYFVVLAVALLLPMAIQIALELTPTASRGTPFVPLTPSWELGSYLLVVGFVLYGAAAAVRALRSLSLIEGSATSAKDPLQRTWQPLRMAGALAKRVLGIAVGTVLSLAVFAAMGLLELFLIVASAKLAGVSTPKFGVLMDHSSEIWRLYEAGDLVRFSLATTLLLIKVALYVVAIVAFVMCWRLAVRIGRTSAETVVARGGFAPVVMLRAFDDDAVLVRGRSWRSTLFGTRYRLEEVIAEDISFLGPFIAIGQPKDLLAPLGAYRSYYADEDWREAIVDWMARSRAVIAIVGTTPSFAWEIDRVLASGLAERMLLVFPPSSPEGIARRWRFLNERLGSSGANRALPPNPPAGILAMVLSSAGPKIVTSRRHHAVDYQVAMRVCSRHLQ